MGGVSVPGPRDEGEEAGSAYETPLLEEIGDLAELTNYDVSVRVP
jgi:hypothetical protein